MICAVVDANVFASGMLGFRRAESAPGEVFRLWRDCAFVLVASAHLFQEAELTLADPFFASRVPSFESEEALEALKRDAEFTSLTVTIAGVASNPEDDLVLAAAVSANAEFLVTGDKQLQRLGAVRGVAVVNPRDFIACVQMQDEHASRNDASAPPGE